MSRIVFRILNGLSIVLLALCVFLCIGGAIRGQLLMRQGEETIVGCASMDGWAMVFAISIKNGPIFAEGGQWRLDHVDKSDIDDIALHVEPTTYRLPGVNVHLLDSATTTMQVGGYAVLIHFGWLIGLFSILPAYWLWTRHKDPRRRAKLGLCVKCGYDLRGNTGDACPECGAIAPRKEQAPA